MIFRLVYQIPPKKFLNIYLSFFDATLFLHVYDKIAFEDFFLKKLYTVYIFFFN